MEPKKQSEELPRAIFHSTLTIIILFAVLLKGTPLLIILIILYGIIEIATKISHNANQFFYYSPYSPLSHITRDEEKTTKDIHAGHPVLIGMLAVQLIFPQFLTPSILILAFADPLARIFGMRYGKRKILHTQKTFVGSGTFWAVAVYILYIAGYSLVTALSVGLFATILEIFAWNKKRYVIIFQDNFLISLGVAIGISVATYVLTL